MANDFLPYQNPTTTDERLDTESLTVGALNVHRERVQIAGAVDVAIAGVINAAPTTEYGVVTRNIPSGTQAVSGTVTASGPLTDAQLRAVAVPISGTVTANLAAGTNNIGDVDVLTVPAPLSTTGGGTEATALRVTLATDSTGLVSVDDNGGSLTVDGTVAVSGTVTVDSELTTADLDTGAGTDTRAVVGLVGSASGGGALIPGSATDGLLVNLGANNDVSLNAGTNNIGDVDILTLPALVAGTANIGDVDVLTVPAPLSTTGGGTEATALRVTLANDSTGLVSVDDNGASLTVDNGGTFVVQENGAALTALQLIDNAISGAGFNITQQGGVAVSLNAGAVDTGTQRMVQANGAGKTILSTGGSAASSGNNTLVAAGTNRLKVFAFSLTTTSATAMTCIFQSGASGTELWRCIIMAPSGANAGANLAVAPPAWLFATASATLLNLNLSSANAVHWSVSYYDEA